MNPTTKRFPRTLEQAFGPYARGGIYEQPVSLSFVDKLITGLCGVILFGLLIAICGGWL
jgi:hypothetical protein